MFKLQVRNNWSLKDSNLRFRNKSEFKQRPREELKKVVFLNYIIDEQNKLKKIWKTGVHADAKNVERFTILRVILAQGPC